MHLDNKIDLIENYFYRFIKYYIEILNIPIYKIYILQPSSRTNFFS